MKLSVCIQAYNHEQYIAQAIDSVLMQKTDFAFEVILGEDESSDGTRAICREYAQRYPDRIKLFLHSRKNVIYIDGRPTGRWNFANNLKSARGEYVALLDGDDYWMDERKLQKQLDFLDAHPDCSSCTHHAVRRYDDGRSPDIVFPRVMSDRLHLIDVIQRNPLPTCSTVLRRKCVTPLPDWFYQLPFGDWCIHVMCAMNGPIAIHPDVMGVYRVHPSGAWSRLSELQKHELAIEQIKLFLTASRNRIYTAARTAATNRIADLYLEMAQVLRRQGCTAAATRCVLEASRSTGLSTRFFRRHIPLLCRVLFPMATSAYGTVRTTLHARLPGATRK